MLRPLETRLGEGDGHTVGSRSFVQPALPCLRVHVTPGVTNVVTANLVKSTRSSTTCYRDLRVAEAMSNKDVSVNRSKVIFTSVANVGLIDAERVASHCHAQCHVHCHAHGFTRQI